MTDLGINNIPFRAAIHGEKVSGLLQDKALRNDRLRKLILSLRAERSNLKALRFHRELLPFVRRLCDAQVQVSSYSLFSAECLRR